MSEQTLGAPAIDKIEKLAKDSQDHTLVAFRPEAEPIDVYLLYDKRSGKHERIIAEPGDHLEDHWHTAAIVAFVAANPTGGTIYISDGIIAGVIVNPDTKRRRIARMTLTKQKPYLDLLAWAQTACYKKQRDFWNLLRTVHRDSVPIEVSAQFMSVQFKDGKIVDGDIGHAASGLSARYAADAKTKDGNELPEEIIFQVGVYDIQQHRFEGHAVKCAIDIDGASQGFRIIPVANALERAREGALDILEKDLRDAINEALPDKSEARTSTEAARTITIVRGTPVIAAVTQAKG